VSDRALPGAQIGHSYRAGRESRRYPVDDCQDRWSSGRNGLLAGTLVSLAITRVIATQLWRVSPYDRATFAGVTAVLLVVALLACYVPARRATTVDPIIALKTE